MYYRFGLIHEVDAVHRRNSPTSKQSQVLLPTPREPLTSTSVAVLGFLVLSTLAPAGLVGLCLLAAVSLVLDLCLFLALFPTALAINLKRPGLVDSVEDDHWRAIGHGNRPSGLTGYNTYGDGKASKTYRPHGALLILGAIMFLIWYSRGGGGLLATANWNRLRLAFKGWSGHRPTPLATGEIADTVRWLQALDPQALEELLRATTAQSSDIVAQIHAPVAVITDLYARNESLIGDTWAAAVVKGAARRKAFALGGTLGGVVATLAVLRLVCFWIIRTGEKKNGKPNSDISLARCLTVAHNLDIYILASCNRRFLVSVGYDRSIHLWDLEAPSPTSEVILPTAEHPIIWPVSLVAVDKRAEWIAICSRNSHVILWNRRSQRFGQSFSTVLTNPIVACLFTSAPPTPRSDALGTGSDAVTRLLLVLESGRLIDMDVGSDDSVTVQICNNPVRSSHQGSTGGRLQLRLFTITRDELIFVSTNRDGWWTTQPLRITALNRGPLVVRPIWFSMIPSLKGIGLVHNKDKDEVCLVDTISG